MSRLNLVTPANATPEQLELLKAIEQQMGGVLNFLKVFANSPDALKAFLGLYGIASSGMLEPATRERIALAVAQQNECEYCVSAHTAISRKAGLAADDILQARHGRHEHPKTAALIGFAKQVMDTHGEVSAADLLTLRAVGVTDAEIIEVIVHVGLNFLTNVVGKVSQVDIDFPKINLQLAA